MEEERLVMSGFREEEDDQESSLRPKTLREYVGQQAVKDITGTQSDEGNK